MQKWPRKDCQGQFATAICILYKFKVYKTSMWNDSGAIALQPISLIFKKCQRFWIILYIY